MFAQIGDSLTFSGLFLNASTRMPLSGQTNIQANVYLIPTTGGMPSTLVSGRATTELFSSGIYYYTLPPGAVTAAGDYIGSLNAPAGAGAFFMSLASVYNVEKAGIGIWAKPLAELSPGSPPITPTLEEALMLLYMALRNKLVTTTNSVTLHNAAGTPITVASASDDGETFIRQLLGPVVV